MLNQYISDTRLLLNDPLSQIYSDAELTGYINRARTYTATLGECVYDTGSVSVTTLAFTIPFSTVVPQIISNGCKLFNPRSLLRSIDGQSIDLRTIDWWNAYVLPATLGSTEIIAAISKQGLLGTTRGAIVIKCGAGVSLPYTVLVAGIWLPIVLVDDSTAEDIPQLWSDAICYYSAYLAYMRYQRQADAQDMLNQFGTKLTWARVAATSSRLPATTESIGGPGTHTAGSYEALGFPPQRGG